MVTCGSCGERNPDRARFCMMCAAPFGVGAPVTETRKIVTVLFADVMGSTAIGERLDPEAVRRVLTTFYSSAREALERHGGTVEKFIGDAVMAVFGVPRVREDDAARAVQAAWDLLDVMAAMNAELSGRYGATLQLRIGVNTGEVVAGDPATGSSFVAGDAVNVAARLEQAAGPGTVYLGAETADLVRAVAVIEPMEPLELKGKSEPVDAFRLMGLRAGEEISSATDVMFVGREAELEALDAALEDVVRSGSSQVVAIRGPAGIGKTRVVRELALRAIGRARAVGCRCSPEGEGVATAPLHDLLASTLGLGPGASVDDVEREARALMGSGDRNDLIVATLSRLLEEGETTEAAWALGEFLTVAVGLDPVIVSVDDYHLAAPIVQGLWVDVRRRLVDAPVLWLEVYRTDAEETAAEPEGARVSDLGPLERSEALALLRATAPELATDVATKVLEAGEGNPLFLIETARLVDERPDTAVRLPSGVRALFAARFDSLTDAERRALEIVATIGRSGRIEWLEQLLDDGDLGALRDLESKGVLTREGDSLWFSHGSFRDVAYATTTKLRRAELHERVAELAERQQEPIEILAHHLERAAGLRAELGAPDDHDRRVSGRAAVALAGSGLKALAAGDRNAAVEILPRASALAGLSADAGAEPRTSLGRLAFALGDWDQVIAILDGEEEGEPSSWNPLGVALIKRGRPGEVEHGRQLLTRAAERGDVDAASALAGSWKGIDEERAYELYRSALELDATDPYALGNVLEYEIQRAGDLTAVTDRRPALASAILRRRGQALAGTDRPWSYFDLAKFELFLGEHEECLASFAAAVATSSAAFMIDTTRRSLERVRAACEGMSGYVWALELLELGRRARFEPVPEAPTSRAWILVGGSGAGTDERMAAYREALVTALAGVQGRLISGGTAQGVSALAADVASALTGVNSVGYLPAELPAGVLEDPRYDELHRTTAAMFGAAEPLAYWRDLLDAEVPPDLVRVLAIGGGRLTALEIQIALALGAHVGVLAGSGGPGATLLGDRIWGTSVRLSELDPTSPTLREFLVE